MSYRHQAKSGVKIEPGADLYSIKQRIGVGKNEELRQSEKRRRYLQKFVRLMSRKNPRLSLSSHVPTAQVNQEKDNPHIKVTTTEFEQEATGFARDVFDLVMQEALTVHELGHIFYTDHGSFKEYLSEIDMERKGMFKKVWNTLEDGAIERQLRQRYAVEDEVLVMNANLFEKDGFGHLVDEDTVRFSVFQAVSLGLSDMAVYDSGDFRRLMDPSDDAVTLANDDDRQNLIDFVPRMKEVTKKVLTEPSSEKRNEFIYEFFQDLEDLLDESEVSGQKQSNLNRLLGGDGSISASDATDDDNEDENGDNENTEARPVAGKPDDTENDYGDDAQNAVELGMDMNEDDVSDQVDMAAGDMDPEDADTDRNAIAGGGADQQEQDSDEQDGDEQDGEGEGEDDYEYDEGDEHGYNVSHDLEDSIQEELAVEAQELDGGQSTIEEVEQFHQIINGDGDSDDDAMANGASYEGFNGLTMDVPEMDDYDDDRWATAEKQGKQLAKILRNRLQRERATRTMHGQRSGRMDRQRMMLAERGDLRVFEREEDDNEKDYDAIIVVDRSGSMSGASINNAEIATATLANACEEVGIGTCILDMYNNEAQLSKPFGVETSKKKGNVVRADGNQTAGGTPLSETVYLARKRVQQNSDKHPFMIVVTDGAPSRPERYREQLDACTFPVLGVYMTSDRALENGSHNADEQMFHRITYATSGEDLDTSLRNLLQEVLF